MIRQLRGTAIDIGNNYVVLDVGGVGYQVYTPKPTSFLLSGTYVFFTHLAVRENAMDLYGFPDRDSLQLFELLIDLPKIGPKSALQFLTQADVMVMKEAVANNDAGYLSKVSGIGKKSAEKIVAGLKDKFDYATDNGVGGLGSQIPATHTSDTIDALISLGYPPQEARRVVIEVTTVNADLTSSAEIVKLALRRLHS